MTRSTAEDPIAAVDPSVGPGQGSWQAGQVELGGTYLERKERLAHLSAFLKLALHHKIKAPPPDTLKRALEFFRRRSGAYD